MRDRARGAGKEVRDRAAKLMPWHKGEPITALEALTRDYVEQELENDKILWKNSVKAAIGCWGCRHTLGSYINDIFDDGRSTKKNHLVRAAATGLSCYTCGHNTKELLHKTLLPDDRRKQKEIEFRNDFDEHINSRIDEMTMLEKLQKEAARMKGTFGQRRRSTRKR
tara:strand:+ start:4106 stop:4606 length:501 start_codon:yes stop_codon:yes gene_type:complete